MELVIASKNLHKVREIKAILKPHFQFDLLSLADFPEYIPPPEKGSSFEENAFLKALLAAKALKKWCLGEDSGLVVPALQNSPGVMSARYAGEGASDFENRTKLLKELASLGEEQRIGYFTCSMALASPEGVQKQVKGMCEGRLILSPKGSQGFGYDPLFIKYDYNKTFAELEEETKNKISHRRKALDKLFPLLETLSQKRYTTFG